MWIEDPGPNSQSISKRDRAPTPADQPRAAQEKPHGRHPKEPISKDRAIKNAQPVPSPSDDNEVPTMRGRRPSWIRGPALLGHPTLRESRPPRRRVERHI